MVAMKKQWAKKIYAWFQASATKQKRTALFWVMTQRVLVIYYRRFGTTYQPKLQWSRILSSRPLRTGPIRFSETSVRNYHYSLRNNPEEWSSQVLCILCVCCLSYPACKAHSKYYIVICNLSGSAIFLHIISYMAWLSYNVIEHKTCILISSTTFVWNIFSF